MFMYFSFQMSGLSMSNEEEDLALSYLATTQALAVGIFFFF